MTAAYFGAGDLIVSSPGFDALVETDLRRLILDTRRGRYIGLYAGPLTVDMSKFTLAQNSTWRVYKQVLPLGKTFQRPPVVRAMYRSIYRSGALACYSEGIAGAVQDSSGNWYGTGGQAVAGFGVSVSEITFYVAYLTYTQTYSGPSAISYIVAHS